MRTEPCDTLQHLLGCRLLGGSGLESLLGFGDLSLINAQQVLLSLSLSLSTYIYVHIHTYIHIYIHI